jgi:hypothetical protein
MTSEELEAIRARAESAATSGEFIAHALVDIPALLAEVERLRAALDAANARAHTLMLREIASKALEP